MKYCSTLNPLYNGTHYNSKILYNVILICTECIFCSKSVFNSKFSLTSKCLGTNSVIVKRVHRILILGLLCIFRNPLLFLDFVYFYLTRQGREFSRLCNFVHGIAEEIINARRKTIVSTFNPIALRKAKAP